MTVGELIEELGKYDHEVSVTARIANTYHRFLYILPLTRPVLDGSEVVEIVVK